MEVAPQLKESLNKNFFDFLLTFKQVSKTVFYLQNQINALFNQTSTYLKNLEVLKSRFKGVPVSRYSMRNFAYILIS